MKTKHIIYSVLFTTSLLFTSCTDLNENIYSSIPMDQFFQNEKELLMNAGRAYTKLQPYPEEQKLWSLVTVSSDECIIPARDDNEWWDNGRWDEIQKHNIGSANKINRLAWEFVFGGVSACNEVLYETEQSKLEFAGKDKIVAEIKILRALFYYWALDAWGDVPLTTDFTDKTLPKKETRANVYKFVEEEILANIDKLDAVATSKNYGRVTQGMAYTLLAKLYMNSEVYIGRARWEEAEAMCDSVIGLNQYALEPDYFDNFKIHNENSKENIFVIVYNSTLTTECFYWYDLTLHARSRETYNINDTPWDGFMTSPEFFQKYSDADYRKKTWIYGQQYDKNGKKIFDINGTTGDTIWFVYNPIWPESKYKSRDKWDGARCGKYEFQTDGLQYDVLDMENDFALFRYADVIMMKAEAMMRQGRTGEAVQMTDFQEIRKRAGMPVYDASLTLDELLDERGREFAWEGHRRQDLMRFGKWDNAWFAKPVTTGQQHVFPIPQTAIDTNPNLK